MKNRRSLPKVIINNNNVNYEIVNWLSVNEYEVERCMQVILVSLGYDDNDKIIIDKCYEDINGNKYLELIVNNMTINRICIFNGEEDNYPYIKIDRDENGWEFYYQVIVYDRNNINLNMYKYNDVIGDRIYNYELSKEWVEYKIEDGVYSLEFRISKPVRLISDFGGYRKYDVNNRNDLVNYLIGLDFNESIFDIFKKICEISIGNDMSLYSMIDLRLSKYVCDENGVIENKLTDLIYLVDGKIVSLMVSKDDKQIWYDSCNDTANYVYDSDMFQLILEECNKNRFSRVNERLNCKNDKDMDSDMSSYIDNAKSEIGMVRKLVCNINGCRDSK